MTQFKPLKANKPGQDTRGDNKPDQKAKVVAVEYKKSILARSGRKGTQNSAVKD